MIETSSILRVHVLYRLYWYNSTKLNLMHPSLSYPNVVNMEYGECDLWSYPFYQNNNAWVLDNEISGCLALFGAWEISFYFIANTVYDLHVYSYVRVSISAWLVFHCLEPCSPGWIQPSEITCHECCWCFAHWNIKELMTKRIMGKIQSSQ